LAWQSFADCHSHVALILLNATHKPWKPVRNRLTVCAMLILILLVAGVSGCGGGSRSVTPTPPPQIQVTPKGTYTITVSATSGNLPQQIISLTLTVN